MDAASYAAFIRQIELKSLWLSSAEIKGDTEPLYPRAAQVDISSSAIYWNRSSVGFAIDHTYEIRVCAPWEKDFEDEEDEEDVVEIRVTFELTFTSAVPMTDAVFDLFRQLNLPVNTWPYAREFVSNAMGRMGWLPLTLPALKRGTEPSPQEQTARDARRAESKRASSTQKAGPPPSGTARGRGRAVSKQ